MSPAEVTSLLTRDAGAISIEFLGHSVVVSFARSRQPCSKCTCSVEVGGTMCNSILIALVAHCLVNEFQQFLPTCMAARLGVGLVLVGQTNV